LIIEMFYFWISNEMCAIPAQPKIPPMDSTIDIDMHTCGYWVGKVDQGRG
jgi:hypothetical protein